MARMAILENDLADKNLLIANHTSVIAERETSISGLRTELTERETSIPKLTGDLQAAMFQLEQLRRMIFGSKRERFVSNQDIN
jgi:hypothetical protein